MIESVRDRRGGRASGMSGPLSGATAQPACGRYKGEGGGRARRGADGDTAAELLHHAQHLGEAEAGALADLLGGEERVEDAGTHVVGDAGAGVADGEADVVAGLGLLRFERGAAARGGGRDRQGPAPGMASRALIARLRTASSSWVGSAWAAPDAGVSCISMPMLAPSVLGSSGRMPSSTAFRSTGSAAMRCWREKARSWAVRRAPRMPAVRAASIRRFARSALTGAAAVRGCRGSRSAGC